MDEVITYNKTYQERLLEFTDVLSGYDALLISQVKKEWSYYLEFAVDPNGWQAIWKIPRLRCEELKIAFPTVVLVYVESIDFKKLEAVVKILAVQDEIHLPCKHIVPLIQLWPTKEQDKSIGLNLDATSNAIDLLRFFYLHIVMPWDLDDEEEGNSDWLSKHLESRLHLFYDMRNGTIPTATAEHLKSLLTEARRLQAQRENLTAQLEDVRDLKIEVDPENTSVQKYLNIHVRMLQIRNEVELLENPLLRNTLLKNQEPLQLTRTSSESENWLVFDHGKIDNYITFLNKVKEHLPDSEVKFVSNLALALESFQPDDTIILSQSSHVFNTIGNLHIGGTLKGLDHPTETILATLNEDVMLDSTGDLLLENLTINANTVQYAVLVRSGTVTIKNCKIVGDGESSTHQGIIVLAGGKLSLIDCSVSGFYIGIVGNSGSEIFLKNCEIFNANIGLKIFDHCKFTAETSQFHNCKDYGICVETEKSEISNTFTAGGFDALEIIPDIEISALFGENNGKGDVIINKKARLQPIQDLFSNPDVDPTITEGSSDEEMEVNVTGDSMDHNSHNNTVVEVESV